MVYQWGADSTPAHNYEFDIRVSNGGPPYTPATITVKPDLGDWDQSLVVDLAGTLKAAIESLGWTVDWIRQRGETYRSVEEAPEE